MGSSFKVPINELPSAVFPLNDQASLEDPPPVNTFHIVPSKK